MLQYFYYIDGHNFEFECREHDKKVCILGLVSLLALPFELLPQELQSGLDQVLKALLKMLAAYKEQLEGI